MNDPASQRSCDPAAIGLGDAVVMNRMFLWGFAMLTAVSISTSVTLLEALAQG